MVVNLVYTIFAFRGVLEMCLKERPRSWNHALKCACLWDIPKRLEVKFSIVQKKIKHLSTNATFLEHDCVNNHKPRSKVVLEEMVSNEVAKSPATTNEK